MVEKAKVSLAWLKEHVADITIQWRQARTDLICDGCEEFIPRGGKTMRAGRRVNEEGKQVFQRHALLCVECGEDLQEKKDQA